MSNGGRGVTDEEVIGWRACSLEALYFVSAQSHANLSIGNPSTGTYQSCVPGLLPADAWKDSDAYKIHSYTGLRRTSRSQLRRKDASTHSTSFPTHLSCLYSITPPRSHVIISRAVQDREPKTEAMARERQEGDHIQGAISRSQLPCQSRQKVSPHFQ